MCRENQPAHRRAPPTGPPLPLASSAHTHSSLPWSEPPFPQTHTGITSLRAQPLPQLAVGHTHCRARPVEGPGVCEGSRLPVPHLGVSRLAARAQLALDDQSINQDSPARSVREEARSHVCVLGPGLQNRAVPWDPGWATTTLGRLSLGPPELPGELAQNSGGSAGLLPTHSRLPCPPRGPHPETGGEWAGMPHLSRNMARGRAGRPPSLCRRPPSPWLWAPGHHRPAQQKVELLKTSPQPCPLP